MLGPLFIPSVQPFEMPRGVGVLLQVPETGSEVRALIVPPCVGSLCSKTAYGLSEDTAYRSACPFLLLYHGRGSGRGGGGSGLAWAEGLSPAAASGSDSLLSVGCSDCRLGAGRSTLSAPAAAPQDLRRGAGRGREPPGGAVGAALPHRERHGGPKGPGHAGQCHGHVLLARGLTGQDGLRLLPGHRPTRLPSGSRAAPKRTRRPPPPPPAGMAPCIPTAPSWHLYQGTFILCGFAVVTDCCLKQAEEGRQSDQEEALPGQVFPASCSADNGTACQGDPESILGERVDEDAAGKVLDTGCKEVGSRASCRAAVAPFFSLPGRAAPHSNRSCVAASPSKERLLRGCNLSVWCHRHLRPGSSLGSRR